MELASVGIDIGRIIFHLVGLDPHGKVVVRKKLSRKHPCISVSLRFLFAVTRKRVRRHRFFISGHLS